MTKVLGTNQEAMDEARSNKMQVVPSTLWEEGFDAAKAALERYGLALDFRWTGVNDAYVADRNLAIVFPDGVEIHFVPEQSPFPDGSDTVTPWTGEPVKQT